MIPTDLYYVVLALFIVAGILNIFQYCIICGLQDRLDNAEDALEKQRKVSLQLNGELRAAKLEVMHQRNCAEGTQGLIRRSDPLFAKIEEARGGSKPLDAYRRQTQGEVDHVHAAVMAGHTGLMAEAMQQHEAEQKKRVDEQRRLDKSKHVGLDVDSHSHVMATSNPSPSNWVSDWFKTEPAPDEQIIIKPANVWRTRCTGELDINISPQSIAGLHEATPIHHSPSTDNSSNPSDF